MAVASFTREEWLKLREVADDREALHDSYEDWQKDVLTLRRRALNNGTSSIEISMTAAEIQGWCRENHLRLDGSARSRYAAEKAKAQDPNELV